MRRGLSLPEVMLSLGLLAFVLISLVSVIVAGIRLQSRSGEVTAATEMARTFLEKVKLQGYAALPATDTTFEGRLPTPRQGVFPPAPYPQTGNFVLTVRVRPVSGLTDVRSVEVRVNWDESGGVRAQTYVAP